MKNILLTIFYTLCFTFFAFGQQASSTFHKKGKQKRPYSQPTLPFTPQVIDGSHMQSASKGITGFKSFPVSPTVLANQPQATGAIEVIQTDPSGVPTFIKSTGTQISRSALTSDAGIESATFMHLDELKRTLPIQRPDEEFAVKEIIRDDQGFSHVKLTQMYKGIEVYGAEAIVHFSPGDEVLLNGRYHATPRLRNVTPLINQQAAEQLALQDVSTHTALITLTDTMQKLLDYTGPQSELVIYRPEGDKQHHLTWHITLRPNHLRRWQYFIDAHTGDILHHYDHTCAIGPKTATGTDLSGATRTVNTFQAQDGTYYLLDASRSMYTGPTNALPEYGTGFIITFDAQNNSPQDRNFQVNPIVSSNNTWDPQAVSAHYNAGVAYSYFENTFSRSSINGEGGDIISFINTADENGNPMDNAFWTGTAMFYGSGNTAFTPLAEALDVAGHEMSHGVVENTANLEYQGQSGSLNESFADIFGVLIENEDWRIGEDVVRTNVFTSGALRNMQDPHNGGSSLNDPGYQPRHMNEIYTGQQNNGGVHINSGIVNRAFYLYATANGMDAAKAGQVYYRALSVYLTRSSQFIDCRLAVLQAAIDLHGAGSTEVTAAENAFDQVGILGGSPGGGTNGQNYQPQLPVNPGQDFVISVDTDPNLADKWWVYDPNVSGFLPPVSQTRSKTRMSITDDGSFGYFISTDGHIREINLGPNPSAQAGAILSVNPEWDNVAVSKDGTKLAAITQFIDTAIFVFDISDPNNITGAKYTLYNPTTAQGGINTGGVLYADAIEWDYSGENLIYDTFNRIDNQSGADIEYWDIGVIRVWDNATNNYGDGNIIKLFRLDQGENIANPTFSKNSAAVIAFDLFNANTGEIKIYGSNNETGDIGEIFTNNTLGYPSFSKNDDKIVFNYISGTDSILRVINLQPNKIQSTGSPQDFILNAKFGTWYSVGNRDINIDVDDELSLVQSGITVYPNPVEDVVTISFELIKPAETRVTVYDLMGKVISTQRNPQTLPTGLHKEELSLGHVPAGTYFIKIETNGSSHMVKVAKN